MYLDTIRDISHFILISLVVWLIALIQLEKSLTQNIFLNTTTGDPLHSRALAHSRAPLFTQPCPHCSHSRAPGEQWARLCVFTLHGCVQAARLCRGSPVTTRRVDGNAVTRVPKSILYLKVTKWLVFTSGHPIDSHPFRSMTIGPPIPEIQFDLGYSRSKVKVKGTPVSAAYSWLISLVFHIRASNRFPSPLFHDNRASHSRDIIWPWKFKVKGTPVSAASSWLP